MSDQPMTWYAQRRAKKLCIRCDNPAPNSARCEFHTAERSKKYKAKTAGGQCGVEGCTKPAQPGKSRCADCIAVQHRLYDERLASGVCPMCGKPPVPGAKFCAVHKASNRARNKKRHAKLRLEVVKHYGGECACCGTRVIEFLHVDHVNNDGAAHRRAIGGCGGGTLYTWLRKHGYPKDGRFQLLCANCNFAKGHYGSCPHRRPGGPPTDPLAGLTSDQQAAALAYIESLKATPLAVATMTPAQRRRAAARGLLHR